MSLPTTPIPVRILTGALGAGKTTLINALLKAGHLDGSAIIVNEFGDIGIDHDLIETATDDVNLLAGGCLCCQVTDDLVQALMRLEKAALQEGRRTFDRVIVETSGVAEPAPLLQLFAQSPYLRGRFHLDALITVVDARLGSRVLQNDDSTPLRQLVLADRLLVNKLEQVPSEQAAQLFDALPQVNPYADIMPVRLERAEAGWLQPADQAVREAASERDWPAAMSSSGATHDEDICCFDLQWVESQSLSAIGEWLHALASNYGERLMRVKGIVAVAGTAQACAVHVVQDIVSAPQFLQREGRASRVVFITRGLEPNDVLPGWVCRWRMAQASRRAPRLFPV